MFLNKYKNWGKVFLIIGLAFLISSFSIKNIFLANSPKIRPNLGGYFLAKINNTKNNILAKLNFGLINFSSPPNNASDNGQPSDNSLQFDNNNTDGSIAQNPNQDSNATIEFLKQSLKPITKGVSAATQDGYSYTEIKLNEIEWVRITYTLSNGETVTIEYPKGTTPPPKEIYEGVKE